MKIWCIHETCLGSDYGRISRCTKAHVRDLQASIRRKFIRVYLTQHHQEARKEWKYLQKALRQSMRGWQRWRWARKMFYWKASDVAWADRDEGLFTSSFATLKAEAEEKIWHIFSPKHHAYIKSFRLVLGTSSHASMGVVLHHSQRRRDEGKSAFQIPAVWDAKLSTACGNLDL